MPRSRTVRALAAGTAGIVGAGSVVCMTLAFTRTAHHATHVASLSAVPAVSGAPRATEPTAGLLAWHAPGTPPPLVLSPLVIGSVRVVATTRFVKVGTSPAADGAGTAAVPRTTPARHVVTPRRATPTARRTPRTSTRPRHHTTRDRTSERTDRQSGERGDAARPTTHDSQAGDGDGGRDDDG